MKIAIRADASVDIGCGHVMRMLTLAKALKKREVTVFFFTCNLPGNLNHIIEQEFHLINLSNSSLNILISNLSQEAFDWLIIDHYQISNADETALKKHLNLHMLCVDDNFTPHTCDILLNQNIYATPSRYEGLVASSTKLLTGLPYALVRDEFALLQNQTRPRHTLPKLLVTLGGSDPDNLLSHILHALKDVNTPFMATVICGQSNQHFSALKALASTVNNVHLIKKTSNMAKLMHEHDCAITAAGSSTIEALIMQLPSIVIPIADNQMEVAKTLDEQNLAITAHWSKNSQLQTMKQTIKSFLSQDCKELRNSLKDLNITPTGADIVAHEIISYKGSNAR